MKPFFFLWTAVFSIQAHALTIRSQEDFGGTNPCLEVSLQKIHDSLIDYKNYPQLSGSKYSPIPLLNEPFLDMYAVDERSYHNTNGPQHTTQKVVRIRLKPYLLPIPRDQKELIDKEDPKKPKIPYVIVTCTSDYNPDGTSFQHTCLLEEKSKNNYGLSKFKSDLTATLNTRHCNNSVELDYTVEIEGNPRHVKEIEKAVADAVKAEYWFAPATLVDSIMGTFQNSDAFFKDYYTNFYQKWVAALQAGTL